MAKSSSSPEVVLRRRILGLHPNVFFLGLVSLLTDVSSEMTLTLLPLFLRNVLGVPTAIIGLIEGVADSTATLLRTPSGWLSDRLGKRKALTTLGYSLSAVSKPFLYLAMSWGVVLGVRFTDRVGKGIRSAPRDALVADSTGKGERGKGFGLHRAMDTSGAILGLGLAALVVFLLQRETFSLERGTFQALVLIALVPGFLAVFLLLSLVKDIPAALKRASQAPAHLDRRFYLFLGVMLLFTLGNSSDAFLLLRAQDRGLSVLQVLLVLVAFNLVYAALSMPAGMLSDRLGRKAVIASGWAVYALIYLGFALARGPGEIVVLFILYGVYYAAFEGVARAMVADLVPAERRGTAYGLFNTAVGITAFPSSVLAGVLWQAFTPAAPFFFGAAMAGLASLLFLALVKG